MNTKLKTNNTLHLYFSSIICKLLRWPVKLIYLFIYLFYVFIYITYLEFLLQVNRMHLPLISLGYMKSIEKYFRWHKKEIYFMIDFSIEKHPGESHHK